MKNRIQISLMILLLIVGSLKSQEIVGKENKDILNSGISIDSNFIRIIEKTDKNNKIFTDTIKIKSDTISNKSNFSGGKTINYDNSRTVNIDYNADINKGEHMNKNRDRNRDLRRDLKRDKNRDLKRDKNKDRVRIEKRYNKVKIKIKS